VPSSTSNSEQSSSERVDLAHDDGARDDDAMSRARARSLDHGARALAYFLVALALSEVGARALDYRPSVTDDARLFALARARANDEGAVVVLGKSRAQLALDPDVWRSALPDRPLVMLARHGESAWAVLDDLARDEGFSGTVLFSFTEEDLTRGAREQARAIVDESARASSVFARGETALRAVVESQLAIANPQLSLPNLVESFASTGARPTPHFTVTRADRTQAADFSRTDAAALRAHYERVRADADRRLGGRPVDDVRWLVEAREVLPVVERLTARGARVVFVKFLHCDEADRASERWFPRASFFDVIAREAGVPALHYRDLEGWSAFSCPDSNHLDERDAPAFTARFVEALRGRGLVE